ncbi:hypothetical protein G647_05940 [Cladophialophora carrionii CBS 160.54]|uniref:Uncharacterized protein n=1 Tax=Cladophialophora carrionii CBS 160.54 TaxID=1279043 RepID=V9D5G2_9EURO|nr:uncharacterized protein G647_05940 [Cladophialophora carrionii CBS 160.54]ETI21871.1 hypothetical protein G647_05940 [Cladophialophora carrionii CBS 160.54]
MGNWDAITAATSGVNPAAYATLGGREYRPVGEASDQNIDTLVTVPVLDLKAVQQNEGRLDASSIDTLTTEKEANREKKKDKGLSSLFRRKTSNFHSPSARRVNIDMRQVTRMEYLKHYAKDDQGGYIGTEDPAEDCILNGEDLARWRGPAAVQAPLSVPLTGIGFETVGDSGHLASMSILPSGTDSTTADTNATSGGKKTRFGLLKNLKGGGTSGGTIR